MKTDLFLCKYMHILTFSFANQPLPLYIAPLSRMNKAGSTNNNLANGHHSWLISKQEMIFTHSFSFFTHTQYFSVISQSCIFMYNILVVWYFTCSQMLGEIHLSQFSQIKKWKVRDYFSVTFSSCTNIIKSQVFLH